MQRYTFVLVFVSFFMTLVVATRDAKAQAHDTPAPVASNDATSTLPRSTGEYLGQKWHVDEKHLLWWDGQPYTPFGGFGIEPDNKFGLKTYNLWIDFDPFHENPKYTREQHRRDIAERLSRIADSGGTCIVQYSMAEPHLPEGPRPGMRCEEEPDGSINASRLADPKVKQAILKVWAEYAPAVRNDCVRAIVLWNEINVWNWPDSISDEQYASLLEEYVREVKRLVGDLPVCLKIAGTWNARTVIAAAGSAADGLGFDTWVIDGDEGHAAHEIQRALHMLEERQQKTTWFFIAEGGRSIPEEQQVAELWDRYPPFRSKEEAARILRGYAHAGAKGFIYNGPNSDPESNYRDSYRWLGELKPEISRLMVEIKAPVPSDEGRARGEVSPALAIAAACSDRSVQQLLSDVRNLRLTVEFSDLWNVWLVQFYSGDSALGFASVSKDGKVLEAGAPETDEQDRNDRRRDDRPKTDRGVESSERR